LASHPCKTPVSQSPRTLNITKKKREAKQFGKLKLLMKACVCKLTTLLTSLGYFLERKAVIWGCQFGYSFCTLSLLWQPEKPVNMK
jgi:hypothetical protein